MVAGDDPFSDDPFDDASSEPSLSIAVSPSPMTTTGRQVVLPGVVVACSALFGWAVYSTVSGLGPSEDGLAHASFWSWAIVLPIMACLAASIACVVVVVRTGGRSPMPWVLTIVSLTLPPISGYIGGRIGVDEAMRHLDESVATLTELGAPLLQWLLRILGVNG